MTEAASRRLMWAVMVLLAATLCLAAGEAIARIAGVTTFHVKAAEYIGWAQPDPVLGWRNRPGVHRADEPGHEPMTILADGSRSTASRGSGPEVLIVGDSFAEGYGIRDDETLAWKLQKRFPDLHIRNFGTPGYGTYQSLLLLRELTEQRGTRPWVVIYGFLPFHAERNVLTYSMLEAFRAFGGQRFSPPHVEWQSGRLLTFPPAAVANWPFEERSALVTLAHRAQLRTRLAGRGRDQEIVTARLLEQMKHGRLLVATLWDGGSQWAAAYRRMSAGMRHSGIEELNVTYRGPETRPEKLHVGATGHPSGLINTWWADRLSEWLAQVRP